MRTKVSLLSLRFWLTIFSSGLELVRTVSVWVTDSDKVVSFFVDLVVISVKAVEETGNVVVVEVLTVVGVVPVFMVVVLVVVVVGVVMRVVLMVVAV